MPVKKIELSQEFFALVDDEDFERVSQFNWHVRITKNAKYAVTNMNKTTVQMHRFIMNCPKDKMVDHENRNGLDNRKSNLRICSRSENLMNSKKPSGLLTSKYKGVNRVGKKWRAEIRKNRKGYYLGTFETEIEAAKAYNKKAKELFGEFAKLNEV